jgi:hypothetical protein
MRFRNALLFISRVAPRRQKQMRRLRVPGTHYCNNVVSQQPSSPRNSPRCSGSTSTASRSRGPLITHATTESHCTASARRRQQRRAKALTTPHTTPQEGDFITTEKWYQENTRHKQPWGVVCCTTTWSKLALAVRRAIYPTSPHLLLPPRRHS